MEKNATSQAPLLHRLLPPRLVLILLIAISALSHWFPGPEVVPAPYRYVGLVIALFGLVLCVRAAKTFRDAGTNIKTFDDPGLLVTHGWFRFSRNPMYLGFALLLFGLAVAAGGVLTLLPPLVFAVAADRYYIPFEERAMARVFGDDYAAYRQRVRRWI